MEPNKVVQALKVLQDEGREDLIKDGVLEQAWVGLRRPKRLSAEGVSAAVAACSSPVKAGKKFRCKSVTDRKVARSPVEIEDENDVVSLQAQGGVKRRGISSLPRRQGSSLARCASALGGRGSICRTAVAVGGRRGTRIRFAHAWSGSCLQARFPLEKGAEHVERPFEERTSVGASKMAAPSADHIFYSARVNSSSGAPSSWEAHGSNKESVVVISSDEEEEVQASEGGNFSRVGLGDFANVSIKGGRFMQNIPRVVSPMLNKVQAWELSNQAVFQLGEQIEFVDSSGAVFKGTVCGEANRDGSLGRAFVSLDFWQQGSGGGPAGCDTSHAYSGHGVQVRHRRSGRIVGGQSLPVKVRAPSEHREEGRVRFGAVHPTSGECIGAADVQPSTSQGAGAGWTYGDEELLDYDDEVEDPVTFHKRAVVAEEAPDVNRGGHVAAPPHELTAGNLPRGEVGNQRQGDLGVLGRARVSKVGVGLREAKNKVDTSIQVNEVTVEGKSEVSDGNGGGQLTKAVSGDVSITGSSVTTACSSPVKIPIQLTASLTSLRDLTPLDSKDGSESSEGSVSAPLSEQIKPKEEDSSDADSNSCTLRNQDMTLLEINGKLCNSVEESESSDDSGSCLAVNKPADSAVQMAHTPEFSDCGDTPALSNNIIEFSDNEETVPVSSELMDFSDREEIPAITKNVMDFSESLKISSVSKQTVEISDKEESQQSETEQPVIRNESLLLEQDTVAASTTDPDLLIPSSVYPVSSSMVSEEQISDLPVSDLDVKPATPMPPAGSLKLKTPENQQSETEAQVLKDVIFPTKTKDLNLNLVFEDLMISTVLSVLLQETIINSKARAENLEPDILFICKVEEVTEQLLETTARQFENLKKENDHQLWLKEQYATLCASPKTSIEQIVPSINDSQKTAPVINISASSSDSLSACSSPVKIPVQLTASLTSLRDLTPLDSKDGSESSEGSVSAPLSEQIKPKEEDSSDADSNSCTLRNQDMNLLEINGKLCNSVEESESSDDSGSCLAVNKPADSAVQMAHTPEFSDCGDTPALSNNIIEFSDNEETVPVSSELMDFSDREEIPAITKNVMDFSESLKISSVSKQTVEISDKEESQQSETEQPVIRNESLLLEQDTVAASTTDPDLLIPSSVYPVSSSMVSEEQISDLPVSDLDVKPATPMPPAGSLKLKTPENQQSETEAQVLKDVIFPTKTKDLNLNLVFEDLMISTVLSVLLQETIINSKARAENLGKAVQLPHQALDSGAIIRLMAYSELVLVHPVFPEMTSLLEQLEALKEAILQLFQTMVVPL
ncbi:hypothetical protein NDU88_005393 [Pleurodeles waltl]|uniref:Uncharacterized protein n=1 Tax=Pleurodeles waltl TaxID=8319 RepID=A0AAV7MY82_PLEWA|nr:hypothetical protein NDU88_005393 [Pleurodeles waltl]